MRSKNKPDLHVVKIYWLETQRIKRVVLKNKLLHIYLHNLNNEKETLRELQQILTRHVIQMPTRKLTNGLKSMKKVDTCAENLQNVFKKEYIESKYLWFQNLGSYLTKFYITIYYR